MSEVIFYGEDEKRTTIFLVTFLLDLEYLIENRRNFAAYLIKGDCFLDGADHLLDPIRQHHQITENLPDNSEDCFTKGQTVHFPIDSSKTEVVFDEFQQHTQYLIKVAVQFPDSQRLFDFTCRILMFFDEVVEVEEWVAQGRMFSYISL